MARMIPPLIHPAVQSPAERKLFGVIRPRAAVYESKPPSDPKSKLREWHRTVLPLKPVTLAVDPGVPGGMETVEVAENLKVRYLYHRRADGTWLVTVTLLNAKEAPGGRPPLRGRLLLPGRVRCPRPRRAVRVPRIPDRRPFPPRPGRSPARTPLPQPRAYAAGHGCAAEWGEERDDSTNRVATSIIPAFKVAPVDPRTAGGDELSMYFLAGADGKVTADRILAALGNLPRDYEGWIKDREAEVPTLSERLRAAATENLKECRTCLERMRAGIGLLKSDPLLRDAFLLANRAILMQQHHSRLAASHSAALRPGDAPRS